MNRKIELKLSWIVQSYSHISTVEAQLYHVFEENKYDINHKWNKFCGKKLYQRWKAIAKNRNIRQSILVWHCYSSESCTSFFLTLCYHAINLNRIMYRLGLWLFHKTYCIVYVVDWFLVNYIFKFFQINSLPNNWEYYSDLIVNTL